MLPLFLTTVIIMIFDFFFFNAESPEKGLISFVGVKRQNAGHDVAGGDPQVARPWSRRF